MWDIGELGPGAGDSVSFQVQVSEDVISGTAIVANATISLSTVPETTPTNDLVSIVRDVAAHGQWVETDEGVPISITLTGSSPTGNPLTHTIGRQPLNGVLSGTVPSLTYTPADNLEGLDGFDFRVSDGVNTSPPAEVAIEVHTGAETVPPEVLYTAPEDGASDVRVYDVPLYPGVYGPSILAQFTEPISATTVTTGTLFVENEAGRRISGTVALEAPGDRASFLLGEPLAYGTVYTVIVTTGVHDTSGNPMAADYVWSFLTEKFVIYLPVVLRGF